MLFYEQAAAGMLLAFSWISPKHEAADHPCLDLAKGERTLKDIYEALRGGKAWEKTLFVVTYDDYGGFCKCGNMWQPALCCSQPPVMRCVGAAPRRIAAALAPPRAQLRFQRQLWLRLEVTNSNIVQFA